MIWGVIGNLFNPGNRESDYIIYQTEEREQFLDLGHRVEFDGQQLLVYQATITKIKSELKQECLLTTGNGFKPNPIRNRELVGVMLQGKVIDRQNDRVKVHLAIDSQQDSATACWFSYASFYAAAGHTGLYVMPELGDTVNLYCPCNDETEAFVINSLRGPGKLKVTDINTKSLRTSFGKDLIFDEHTITVIGKEGAQGQDTQVYLQLHDNGTINLYSDSNITIDAANNLIVNAGAKLSVIAASGLEIACGQCDLNMNCQTTFDTPQFKNIIIESQSENETETEDEQQEQEEQTEESIVWFETNDAGFANNSEAGPEAEWDDEDE
jgi:phage baseplate assembly protein gpV